MKAIGIHAIIMLNGNSQVFEVSRLTSLEGNMEINSSFSKGFGSIWFAFVEDFHFIFFLDFGNLLGLLNVKG